MSAREVLRRYLLQLQEAGEEEVFLDQLDTEMVRTLLYQPSEPAREPLTAARGSLLQALAEHAPGVMAGGEHQTTKAGPPPMGDRDPGALKILGQEVAGCTDCALHSTRQNVVFGEGSPTAELVIVGEAPGGEEDRSGRPFVGRAGKLLDLLLMSAGFRRDEVYICNVLKCRPPGNRDPEPEEIAACSKHLSRQLEMIGPRVLLAAGRVAAQALTGERGSMADLRRVVHDYQGIPLLVTYHPAFLLRSSQWTRVVWGDLQRVRAILEREPSP